MKNILVGPQRALLRRFCLSKALVVFDYDGTLAPIASEPAVATMRRSTRALLDRVARCYPCAVVTGRSRASALKMLEGVPLAEVVGNYGAEWARSATRLKPVERLVREWKKLLAPRLRGLKGVMLEDKRYSLSVHYRAARNRRRALEAIRRAVQGIPRAHVEPGLLVLNLMPQNAPTKADAVRRLRHRLHCAKVIFVGDDVSDEPVFESGPASMLLGIRVGASARSSAAYCLTEQRRIDDLLRALYEVRFERPKARVR